MIVVACLAPHYVECRTLASIEMQNPEICRWWRPTTAMAFQFDQPDNWRTFTRCELVNPEKNGRRG